MLGDDDFGQAAQVVALFVLEDLVVFGAMDEAHHIGILFDGTRLAEVGQLGTLSFALASLDTTVQLRQCDDRDVEFLGQSFQRTRNGRNFLFARTELHTSGRHQLQVVDHNDLHAMFAHQSAGFRTKFEYRQTRGVVHIDGGTLQLGDASGQFGPLIGGQPTALHLLARDFADVLQQSVHELKVTHFQTEHTDGDVVVHRHVLHHRKHQRRLAHGRTCGDDYQVGVLPA